MSIRNCGAAVGPRCGVAALILAGAVVAFPAAPAGSQEGMTEVAGAAILDHGAGKAVIAAGTLVKAGRLAEVKQASVREVRDEWAAMPVADQRDETALARERAPDPGTLEAEIARSGVLTIYGDSASLLVPSADERSAVMAFASLEDGVWHVTGGPMTIDTAPVEDSRPELQGADILDHEIGRVALAYASAIAAGDADRAMEYSIDQARLERLSWSAEERAESDRYLQSLLPDAGELADQIRTGGQVFFEGDRAFLAVVTTTRTEQPDGTVDFSSTSFNLPFALENSEWKVAN